jgi:YVTN family beta-propeller protein
MLGSGVGNGPQGVAVTPDGATAYVANFDGGDVTPIDVATNTAGTVIRRRQRRGRGGGHADEASPPAPVCPAAAQASLGAGSLAGAEGVVAVAPLGLQALFRRRRRVRRAGCPEPAGSRRRERVRVVLTGLMVAGVRIAVLAVCQPVKKTPPVC